MLTYLFIITIAYEFIVLIRNVYLYRKIHLTSKEKEIMEKEQISPETKETAFELSIFSCIVITLMSVIGIVFSGAFAIVIGVTFIVFCAVGASCYTISYGKGFDMAMIFAIYNYIMMMLFVWSVYEAV